MKIVRTSVLVAVMVVFAAVAQASDPFYAALLTRGVSDAQRGEHFKAVKELRIAAFGLVDDPVLYLRAQVYLANSLEKLGQHADAATAVDKASRAERINASYATAAIDPDTRSTFEALAAKSLRPEQLAMLPSFKRTAATAPPPVITATPKPVPAPPPVVVVEKPVTQTTPPPAPKIEPVAQKPAPVVTTPPQKPAPVVVQKPAPVVAQKPAVVQTKTAPPPAPTPQPVADPKPPVVESPLVAAAKRQPSQALAASDPGFQISEAQRLLNEGKILAARQIYVRLAQSEGLSRATLLDVAKGLNQTSAWRESSTAYQKVMPFRSGEEMHQFYEAVNRYELGELTAARDILTRALPSLPVTRETSLYKAKILGMQ